MFRIIQWLIFGHIHKWELITTEKRLSSKGDWIGNVHTLRCIHCGIIKEKKTSP